VERGPKTRSQTGVEGPTGLGHQVWLDQERRLRDRKTGDNPVLFKINMDSGHAGASGRFSRLEEIAYIYAYALKVTGRA